MSEQSVERLEVELRTIRGYLEEWKRKEADLLERLGRAPSEGAGAGSHVGIPGDEVEHLAKQFEAMTSDERIAVYRSDPEKHKRFLDARETYGHRQLGRNGR